MSRHRKTRRRLSKKRRSTRGRKQRGGGRLTNVCSWIAGKLRCSRGSSINNNNNSAVLHAEALASIDRSKYGGVYSGDEPPNNLPFGHTDPDGYVVHTRDEAIEDIGKTVKTLARYLYPYQKRKVADPITGIFTHSMKHMFHIFTITDINTNIQYDIDSQDKFIYKVLE